MTQNIDSFSLRVTPNPAAILLIAVSGIATALLLAWFMHFLIETGDRRLDTSERVHMADFVRSKRSEVTKPRQSAPKRPVMEKAPDTPALDSSSDSNADSIAVADIDISLGDANLSLESGLDFGGGDGEYLPIVKVAPVYPMRALTKRLEGSCMVEYTVTSSGQTKNIRVVEGHCEYEIFAKPSINAAQKFRYKPRVIDGQAIEVPGVKNIFHFTMAKENAS